MKKLAKIENEGKISGVCAGLARYFNIDVTLIRIVWLLAVFLGVGSPILIYIIMAIVMPNYDPNDVDYEVVEDDRDEYNSEDRYR